MEIERPLPDNAIPDCLIGDQSTLEALLQSWNAALDCYARATQRLRDRNARLINDNMEARKDADNER